MPAPLTSTDWYLSDKTDFQTGMESFSSNTEKFVYLKSIVAVPKTFGFICKTIEPSTYKNKRLRFTASVKTQLTGGASVQLWLRVDGDWKRKTECFDNMYKSRIKGNTDWNKYSVVVDVPASSNQIVYGVLLNGSGQLWIDNIELESIEDEAVPTRKTRKAAKASATKSTTKALKGWNHQLLYNSKAKYSTGVDTETSFNGKPSAFISIKEAAKWETVELYQFLNCDGYRGKRIRFSAQLKTLDANHARLLVDVKGPHEGTVALDKMDNRELHGTNDWTPVAIVLDIPESAVEMKFGARITADGTMWFSDLQFEEVTKDIAVTDDYSVGCRGIWWTELINTDFRETEEEQYKWQSSKPGTVAKGWLSWCEPEGSYETGIDSTHKRNDKNSGCIKRIAPGNRAHNAGLFQKFDAKIYRGKRVRLTAFVKTSGANEKCGLSLIVMDSHQSNLFSQNTFDIDSNVEHDWLKREIVVDVPPEAGVFMVSLDIVGDGSAWINEPLLEIVDSDVPLTLSSWKAKPLNLDFSD